MGNYGKKIEELRKVGKTKKNLSAEQKEFLEEVGKNFKDNFNPFDIFDEISEEELRTMFSNEFVDRIIEKREAKKENNLGL